MESSDFFSILDWRTWLALAIALGNFGYEVEDYAVRGRTQKFQVLGMRPHKRHRCACGFAVEHQLRRHVRPIPDLLGQKPGGGREVLHRAQEWPGIAAGGEFIVAALACEQWPGTPHAPANVGSAVVTLSITVMRISFPARAGGKHRLERGVYHAQ